MEKAYKKSLQMIKDLKIESAGQYKELSKNFLVLNIVSLKYISGTKNFTKIVEYANRL